MAQANVEHVLDYISQSMALLVQDLDRLKKALDSAVAAESSQASPEVFRTFSGYLLTINKFALVMTEVVKMLEAGDDGQSATEHEELNSIKQ
jgi:hypothetical protein